MGWHGQHNSWPTACPQDPLRSNRFSSICSSLPFPAAAQTNGISAIAATQNTCSSSNNHLSGSKASPKNPCQIFRLKPHTSSGRINRGEKMLRAIFLAVLMLLFAIRCLGNESQAMSTAGTSAASVERASEITLSPAWHRHAKESVFNAPPITLGLDFPSNGETSDDIRFRFIGKNLMPMYPVTFIWRVKLRRQAGYYTTFFWGPDGSFTGDSYYGCHPYPDGEYGLKHNSQTHKWELSINGEDYVRSANGHSTQLGYEIWKTQVFVAYEMGNKKIHEFYWDFPDTTRVIRVDLPKSYGSYPPKNPALTFGDAPWALGSERLSGILRGIQLYSSALSLTAIRQEIELPLSTKAGNNNIWYLNLNPTPDDIADKSGNAHHPEWVSSARARLWGDDLPASESPRLFP